MRMPSCRIEITHIRQQAHGKAEHMHIHMPLHIIIACICFTMFSASFLLEIVVIIATFVYLVNRQNVFLLYSSAANKKACAWSASISTSFITGTA